MEIRDLKTEYTHTPHIHSHTHTHNLSAKISYNKYTSKIG